ncbi:hypothetical protein [Sorangium cellulosum]|uniref:hypothetical protein n=1 Tax=Sorangium cellulosum TaxID=56 RepID=UPI0005D1464D|nr:hypothetical protein [Sorangium cellulosum]
MGHTEAALGGEAGGNYENRYCFRRPLVIDRCFGRDDSAGRTIAIRRVEFAVPNRGEPSHPSLLLPLPPCRDSLSPFRRRRLLALLGTMVLEALRASPRPVEVDDERRHC